MSDAPTLIVPMNVTALCVGNTDVNGLPEQPNAIGTKDFAAITDDFSVLPWLSADGQIAVDKSNVATWVAPDPFKSVAVPLEQGIHLHWALPSALTHGATTAADAEPSVDFPEAPNRWLVARIVNNSANPKAPATRVDAWVIESDRLWDPAGPGGAEPPAQDAESRAVPIASDPLTYPNKAFMSMGRCVPYEAWTETKDGAFATRHTALGYGTETYAAAYPHCRNVFGFHDVLDDLDLTLFPPAGTRLSYLVTGWYSDPAKDPLQVITYPKEATDAQKIAAIAAAYGWTFASDATTIAPSGVLCSGLLTGITWDPDRHYIYARPASPVTVAIGNTAVEALSALVASQPASAPLKNVEDTLNALQLGLLPGLDQPGGVAALDDKLHQAGFAARARGEIWTVARVTAGDATDAKGQPLPVVVSSQDLLEGAAASTSPLPAGVGDALDELNVAQENLDRAGGELDAMRGRLFADWHKYMSLRYDEKVEGVTSEDAFRLLQAEVRAIAARSDDLATLASARDAAKSTVEQKLKNAADVTFTLRSTTAPRYWQPREPVVLLQGADLVADPRYGAAGGAPTTPCRLSGTMLTEMRAGANFTVTGAALPALPSSPAPEHRDALGALLADAFFVDVTHASLLASLVASQGGDDNPARADFAAFTAGVAAAQRNLWAPPAPGPVTFKGTPPPVQGVSAWAPPWIPVTLQWRVKYQPVLPVGSVDGAAAAYPDTFIKDNYALDAEDIELSYTHASPAALTSPESYSGTIVLGRHADLNLKAQIESYLANFPDPDGKLKAILDHLPIAAMAQTLSGFNEALVMRRQTLQLPVSDPLALIKDSRARANVLNIDVAHAIGARNDSAPVPAGFYNPLRGGWMTIDALRVIDAFGQVRDLTDIDVVRAHRFVPPDDHRSSPPVIALPPRVTQPSRLQFRWMSAESDLVETNAHPATSPVCGWVLFNHLDRALMLYDAAGMPLGSLNTRGPLWQGAPGNPDTFGKSIDEVFDASRNRHLAKFALDTYRRGTPVAFLTDLLAAIDRTTTNVNPPGFKQDQALAVLIGRPLALVRASLEFDLDGLPAVNQSWDAFTRTALNRTTMPRDTAAFELVKIFVRLGDLGRIDDGLIGYFTETGHATYDTFYAHGCTTSAHGVVAPAPDQLPVQADPSKAPTLLTMLVDPCAPVHATTGLLPVKAIEIPPDMYAGALNRMAVTFLTAPVLSGTAAFSVPVPAEKGYEWSWVSRAGSEWSTLDRIPPMNPRATFLDPGQLISEGWLRLTKQRGG